MIRSSLLVLASAFTLLPACSFLGVDDPGSTGSSSPGSTDEGFADSGARRDSGGTQSGDGGATFIDAGHKHDGGGGGSNGTDGDGGTFGPDPRCVTLSDCCPTLPGPDQGSCDDTVANDDGAACDNVYETLAGEGFCNGPTPNCADLDSCCQEMSGSNYSSCEDTVADNNDTLCANTLLSDRSSGLCGDDVGTGPECSALADCCPSLPDPNAESACDGQVQNGIESNCSAYLSEYQSLGYCN